jgi:hypothetical protein
MSNDATTERQTSLETVRRAYLLLVAANDHFQHLLSSLPPEDRSQFQTTGSETLRPNPLLGGSEAELRPTVGLSQKKWTRRTQPGKQSKALTLKDTIRAVVKRSEQGLTLRELIDAVMGEYQSPRSPNQRHVVRTVINQLARSDDEEVVQWNSEKRRYVAYPF